MSILQLLPYLSAVLAICITLGGLFAMRQGYTKQASEIQEQVIAALKTQNELQEAQIAAHEKEIARLKRVVATIQMALKRRGLRIEVNGSYITLVDEHAKQSRSVTIQMTDKYEPEEDKHQEGEDP